MDRTDAQLAADCLAGDRAAFGALVERHQDAVYHLAYRMTGNGADADDVAQEAFIRAFRRLAQYKPEFAFRNWVMGICANLARNGYRQRARRAAAEQEHAEMATLERTERVVTERHVALDRALMALPEATRLPLVLKYMEGCSLEDIAQTLRIGLGAVKMRLLRGREELARRMETGRRIVV